MSASIFAWDWRAWVFSCSATAKISFNVAADAVPVSTADTARSSVAAIRFRCFFIRLPTGFPTGWFRFVGCGFLRFVALRLFLDSILTPLRSELLLTSFRKNFQVLSFSFALLRMLCTRPITGSPRETSDRLLLRMATMHWRKRAIPRSQFRGNKFSWPGSAGRSCGWRALSLRRSFAALSFCDTTALS